MATRPEGRTLIARWPSHLGIPCESRHLDLKYTIVVGDLGWRRDTVNTIRVNSLLFNLKIICSWVFIYIFVFRNYRHCRIVGVACQNEVNFFLSLLRSRMTKETRKVDVSVCIRAWKETEERQAEKGKDRNRRTNRDRKTR